MCLPVAPGGEASLCGPEQRLRRERALAASDGRVELDGKITGVGSGLGSPGNLVGELVRQPIRVERRAQLERHDPCLAQLAPHREVLQERNRRRGTLFDAGQGDRRLAIERLLAQHGPVGLGGGPLIAAIEGCPGELGGRVLRPGGLLLHGWRQRTRFVAALVHESGGPESEEKASDVRHHRHALARLAYEAEHLSREPEAAPEPGRDQERAPPDPPDHVRHADAPAAATVAERAHAGGDRA